MPPSRVLEFAPQTWLLPGAVPVGVAPGLFPINRFFVAGQERRMLIDSGAPSQLEETLDMAGKLTDLGTLDYLFLTHLDPDHTGAVEVLLERSPRLRLLGGIANLAKGTQMLGLPPERFAVQWPGEQIDLGGRSLTVEASLLEDGSTFWLSDPHTGTLFSSDGFGAAMEQPVDHLEEFGGADFQAGFRLWHTIHFTQLPDLDVGRFRDRVEALHQRGFRHLASAHGPVLSGQLAPVFELMKSLTNAPPLPALDLPPQWRLSGS